METASEPTPDAGRWDDLVREFDHHGIPLPPVSGEFRPAIRRIAPLTYSTRATIRVSPYNVAHYVDEAQEGAPDPYCIVAHVGHGINSWGIHYYEVSAKLALFVQSAWGGVYGGQARDSKRLRVLFEQCRELRRRLQSNQNGLFAAPLKLIVVEVSFYEKRWALHGSHGSEGWSDTDDPLAAATRYVAEEGRP